MVHINVETLPKLSLSYFFFFFFFIVDIPENGAKCFSNCLILLFYAFLGHAVLEHEAECTCLESLQACVASKQRI